MTKELGIGIIGCGNISTSYLMRAPLFRGITIAAVADINMAAAEARASEYGVRALTVEDLLADPAVDIVLNLTIPAAHYDISKRALEAGKHVYSEKPYVLSVDEGRELGALAKARGLRIGSAPDTILGGSHQLARKLVEDGAVGRITSGLCTVISHGMEHWHPNPDFFFQPGAGPVLDLGPYHIANMVQLIGAVTRVTAVSRIPSKTRTIGNGPRLGEEVPVDTPTTIHALLEFDQGAVVSFVSSWDCYSKDVPGMTLWAEQGTMTVPDPNFFDGALVVTDQTDPIALPDWDHPFGVANRDDGNGRRVADYRTAGLADMAISITEDRPHRCNDDFALHVIDVMTSILRSGELGQPVEITTPCARPAFLSPDEARGLMLDRVTA